jgi:hypothetical protein
VAPPQFYGIFIFVSPNSLVPIVNHEQVDGLNDLNDRGSRWLLMVMGHLKQGGTPAHDGFPRTAFGYCCALFDCLDAALWGVQRIL